MSLESYIFLKNFIDVMISKKDEVDQKISDIIDNNPRILYQHKPYIVRDLYNKALRSYPELLVKSSKLITVQFSVKNIHHQIKPLKMLIDTGASGSLIKYNSTANLELMDFVDTNSKSEAFGVGGKQKCYGLIPYIEMVYKDCAFPTSLQVLDIDEHANFDGILGIDFLTMFSITIDFGNRNLIVNGHLKIPINISC